MLGNMVGPLWILGNDVVDGNEDDGNVLMLPPWILDWGTLGRKALPSWNLLGFLCNNKKIQKIIKGSNNLLHYK